MLRVSCSSLVGVLHIRQLVVVNWAFHCLYCLLLLMSLPVAGPPCNSKNLRSFILIYSPGRSTFSCKASSTSWGAWDSHARARSTTEGTGAKCWSSVRHAAVRCTHTTDTPNSEQSLSNEGQLDIIATEQRRLARGRGKKLKGYQTGVKGEFRSIQLRTQITFSIFRTLKSASEKQWSRTPNSTTNVPPKHIK